MPIGGPDIGNMKNSFANPVRVTLGKIGEISATALKTIDFRPSSLFVLAT